MARLDGPASITVRNERLSDEEFFRIRREEVLPQWETGKEIDKVLAAWIRGQLMVIGILAVLYSVGLSIAGVKMACSSA